MKLEMSMAEVLVVCTSAPDKRGHKELLDLVNYVMENGRTMDTLDSFVDAYFEGDGDALIDAVLHDRSETLDQLDEYMDVNEARQIRRSRESRIRRHSRLNYRR